MTTTSTPDPKPEHTKSRRWTALDRDPADTPPKARDGHFSHANQDRQTGSSPYDDPTQGRKIGSDPYDDLTQGARIGSHRYDDPTQGSTVGSRPNDDPTLGRRIGSRPYDDPTQGRKIGSDPYDDPTRPRKTTHQPARTPEPDRPRRDSARIETAHKPDETDMTETCMSVTTSRCRFGETLPGSWQLDPRRSRIEFHVALLRGLVTVRGRFENYRGELNLSSTPAIDLAIDVASVQTGNRTRDRHLRSADFFDAENYPQMRFCSDSVDVESDSLNVSGRLSARGCSIPLELNAPFHRLNGELELNVITTAPHRDLGMTWSPFGIVPSSSQLLIKAYLIPTPDAAA